LSQSNTQFWIFWEFSNLLMSQSSQSSGLSLASLSASASSLLSSVKDLASSNNSDSKEVLVKLFFPETNFYRTFKFEKGAKVEDLLKEVKRTARTPIEHFEQYGIFVSNPTQKTSICLDAFSLLANHDQNKVFRFQA
jgi:hypothetical protein